MSPRAKTIDRTPPEPEPEEQQERQARLSFALNDDGSIDLEHTRPATVAKLKTAIAASPALKSGSGETPEAEKFPRDFVPPLWDSVAVLTRTVGKIFFAWPPDLAKAIKFSDQEKENLTEPTALMIDKYGVGLHKYAIEINFLNAVANNVSAMATRAVQEYVSTLNPDPRQQAQPGSQPVNGRDVSPAEKVRIVSEDVAAA